MYQTINGWTKARMKAQIRAKNNGAKSGDETPMDDKMSTEVICKYRDKTGNACAVGCFIKDEDYKAEFEGMSLSSIVALGKLEPSMPLDVHALRKMQIAHDDAIVMPKGGDMRDLLCEWIDKNVID